MANPEVLYGCHCGFWSLETCSSLSTGAWQVLELLRVLTPSDRHAALRVKLWTQKLAQPVRACQPELDMTSGDTMALAWPQCSAAQASQQLRNCCALSCPLHRQPCTTLHTQPVIQWHADVAAVQQTHKPPPCSCPGAVTGWLRSLADEHQTVCGTASGTTESWTHLIPIPSDPSRGSASKPACMAPRSC